VYIPPPPFWGAFPSLVCFFGPPLSTMERGFFIAPVVSARLFLYCPPPRPFMFVGGSPPLNMCSECRWLFYSLLAAPILLMSGMEGGGPPKGVGGRYPPKHFVERLLRKSRWNTSNSFEWEASSKQPPCSPRLFFKTFSRKKRFCGGTGRKIFRARGVKTRPLLKERGPPVCWTPPRVCPKKEVETLPWGKFKNCPPIWTPQIFVLSPGPHLG